MLSLFTIEISGKSWMSVVLGMPLEQERYYGDCNGNAVPDGCDLETGDCSRNGIPDSCDLAVGRSTDVDQDGIPDECGPDCNGNGRPDECDRADGTSLDCNHNAVPDECDIASGRSRDCNGNGDPAADISDPVYLLSHLFLGGPRPAAPSPDCGADELPDVILGCETTPESCE